MSSTVPVTAVPGTIQVLLYLTKDLVLLARYFVPCTDPRYKVKFTCIKSNLYLFRYFVSIKEQCGVKNPYVGEYGGVLDLRHTIGILLTLFLSLYLFRCFVPIDQGALGSKEEDTQSHFLYHSFSLCTLSGTLCRSRSSVG